MKLFINNVEYIICTRENGIEAGLLNVCLGAVKVFQSGIGVDGNFAGSEAYNITVSPMESHNINVTASAQSIVDRVRIGNFGEEGARIFCKRMESKTVDYYSCYLCSSRQPVGENCSV